MKTGQHYVSSHPTFLRNAWRTLRFALIAWTKRLGPAIPLVVVAALVRLPILRLPRAPLSIAAWIAAGVGYLWFWRRVASSAQHDFATAGGGIGAAIRMLAVAEFHRVKHDQAMRIIDAYNQETKLFALLLRNFDSEVQQAIKDPFFERITPHREWQRKLSAALHPLPLIKIANRSDLSPAPDAAPAILLHTESWRDQIAGVIERAALIIVDFDHASESIDYELLEILEQRKQYVTVLILPSDRTSVPVELPSDLIARFSRVVREDEIPYDDLQNCPAFSSLLHKIAALSALSPDERAKRMMAIGLQGAAMALSRDARIDEALAAFQKLASLYEELEDRPNIEGTYRYMAALHCCACDDEAAAKHYLHARRIEEPDKTSVDLDEMRQTLALTLFGQDNPKCALLLLNRVVEEQRQSPAGQRLPMLYTLARVHEQSGSPAEAARVLCDIAALEHERGEIRSSCQAYFVAAEQTFAAGDDEGSKTLLNRAFDVASELGAHEGAVFLQELIARWQNARLPKPR